jgi:hypothetical protein
MLSSTKPAFSPTLPAHAREDGDDEPVDSPVESSNCAKMAAVTLEDNCNVICSEATVEGALHVDQAETDVTLAQSTDLGSDCPVALEDNAGEGGEDEVNTHCGSSPKQCLDVICFSPATLHSFPLVEAVASNVMSGIAASEETVDCADAPVHSAPVHFEICMQNVPEPGGQSYLHIIQSPISKCC